MTGQQLHFFSENKEKPEKKRYSVSLENICIGAVILVVLLVLSFVLGIEKGKLISPARLRPASGRAAAPSTAAERPLPGTDGVQADREVHTEIKTPEQPEDSAQEKKQGFTIQVASFKNRERAEKEIEYLAKEGYSAEICKKGDYLAIFVGEYSSKDDARPHWEKLKKHYNDCFIRRF